MKIMTVKLEVFTSHSCPHCPKAIAVAEEVVPEFGDSVEYEHYSVEENMDKVQEYQIMSVPTLVINGKTAFIGAPTNEELTKKLKKAVLRDK